MKLTKKDIDELYLVDLRLKAKAWSIGKLEYKLHSAQRKIYETIRNTQQREVVILCARRFGKSYLGCVMAIEDCLRTPGVQVRIIAPDIKQASAIVVPLISKIAKDSPPNTLQRTKSEHKWIIGKSELILGGFDTTNIESHRGSESYSIYIEESGVAHPDQYSYAMNDVLKPQLLHTRGKIVHLTTPPKELNHPFTLDTCSQAKHNDAYFKYTIYDNPLLDQEQINEAISDCGGTETTAFKREYLCEIVKDENTLVFPEFKEEHHFLDFPFPECAVYTTSIDFGGIRDKTVALVGCYDFLTGNDLIVDERVFPINTDTKTIIDSVKDMEVRYNITQRFCDSSGQTHVDLHRQHNYWTQLPFKDDLDAAINAVRLRLGQGKILVHNRCKFLKETLNNAQYNDRRTDFLRTEFLGHCDAGMALVYLTRMMDRKTDPYPKVTYSKDNVVNLLRPKHELANIASTLQPKRFGTLTSK